MIQKKRGLSDSLQSALGGRKAILLGASAIILLAPFAVLWALPDDAAPTSDCETYQPAPSPLPWPDSPASTGREEWRDELAPSTDALATLSSIEPIEQTAGGIQRASVTVDTILWQSAYRQSPLMVGGGSFETAAGRGGAEAFHEGYQAMQAGRDVVFGLRLHQYQGAEFSVSYALDPGPERPEYFGLYPFAERDTGQLKAFLEWCGNPLEGANPVELLRTWNAQEDAPLDDYPARSALAQAFSRFLEKINDY